MTFVIFVTPTRQVPRQYRKLAKTTSFVIFYQFTILNYADAIDTVTEMCI
jgi:hypothetical protein